MNRKVVITGMGVVSPIGTGLSIFRVNLRNGVSGYAPVQSFDAATFPVKNAFEVKNFEARSHGTHLLDPFIQYAVASAGEALQNAFFEPEHVDPYRIGISMSSSKGGMHTLDRFAERFRKTPSAILGARIYANSVPNFGAQWIARRWKVQGPAKCYVAACATGTTAVIEGARMVASGQVDYCIAGASDASVVPVLLAAYNNMGALSKGSIRPFDKNRDGFSVGEGAGAILLETEETAKARGAKIYGEIAGFSYGSECNLIHFDDEQDSLKRTVQQLMEKIKWKASDIDYLNLHGTGTPHGDLYETTQLKKAFGKDAHKISMSSIKSMTGHMLGASGAVEIIACLLAMEENFVPPTVGLETPDPACDLDYTPGRAKEKRVKNTVSVSMGFGGHIAAIALRKGHG